jgi:hypothetical protein
MITNLHPPTALIRTERFFASGGFDESMRDGYEDWDFWLRIAERGWRGVRIRQPVYTWRRHSRQTMIEGAVRKHETLYRRIVENHRSLYGRHADALIARMNLMLREHDMNWLDESGDAIHLRGLIRQRERYEAMRSVRLHHALHRAIDELPRPIGAAARGVMGLLKRLVTRRPEPHNSAEQQTAIPDPGR